MRQGRTRVVPAVCSLPSVLLLPVEFLAAFSRCFSQATATQDTFVPRSYTSRSLAPPPCNARNVFPVYDAPCRVDLVCDTPDTRTDTAPRVSLCVSRSLPCVLCLFVTASQHTPLPSNTRLLPCASVTASQQTPLPPNTRTLPCISVCLCLCVTLPSYFHDLSKTPFDPARRAAVEKQIATEKVVVYSKTFCPYASKTKALLRRTGVSSEATIVELNLLADATETQAILFKITGQKTVPNCFIGGRHVGGNSDMQRLAGTGELKQMLDAAGVVADHAAASASASTASPRSWTGCLTKTVLLLALALGAAVALLPETLELRPAAADPTRTMLAVAYSQHGNSSTLQFGSFPRPVIRDDQVLVAVRYAALNPCDFKFRRGTEMPSAVADFIFPKPKIPSADFAGIIVEGEGR